MWNNIYMGGVINPSGTYVGTVRGIYYQPTMSSTTGLTHRAWESTAGDMIVNAGSFGLGTSSPQRLLHVAGEARITDLTSDTPTRIVGADADGDLGELTLGSGLAITAGQLNTTSAVTWLKTELEASRDVTIAGGSSTDFRIQTTRIQFDEKTKIGSDSSFVHNPGQDTTYLKGTLRIKTGFLNLQNETGGAYINIQAQGSGNKEAGILMESRGSFGNVLYINGESLSTLGVYNFDKVGGGGFNVLIGESPGFTGMASIGDFIVTDSTSNSAGSGRRFKLDSRGDARFYDYGTGNKQATDLGKAQSNYVTGFATDGTVVEIEGLHVDSTELVIFDSYTASAPFTPNAVGEEASELFLTTSATTGKVLQRKMRETSWTNSNASITDDMLELAQDVFMYANCLAAASDSTVIDLPTPSSNHVPINCLELLRESRSGRLP